MSQTLPKHLTALLKALEEASIVTGESRLILRNLMGDIKASVVDNRIKLACFLHELYQERDIDDDELDRLGALCDQAVRELAELATQEALGNDPMGLAGRVRTGNFLNEIH